MANTSMTDSIAAAIAAHKGKAKVESNIIPCPPDHPQFPKNCAVGMHYYSTVNNSLQVVGQPSSAGTGAGAGGGSSTGGVSKNVIYVVGGIAVLGIAAYLIMR